VTLLPRGGYARRLWGYLGEMYPLEQRVPGAALLALAVAGLFRRIHGIAGGGIGPATLLAAWNAFTFLLVLRLMDELKDQEVDRALFPDRPLPSGRIEEADIVFSLRVASILFLAPNLASPATALAAALVLGWALLMVRWFFVPAIMRPNLLLTLATHNPIVPLLALDLVVVVAAGERIPLAHVRWVPALLLVAMVWAISFAWEIARKIRSAAEENEYVTYSRLLGRRGAVALAAAAQTVSFAIGLYLWRSLGLHWVFPAFVAGAWAGAMWAHARFLIDPSPATPKLRRPAEGYAVAVLLAAAAGSWLPS